MLYNYPEYYLDNKVEQWVMEGCLPVFSKVLVYNHVVGDFDALRQGNSFGFLVI